MTKRGKWAIYGLGSLTAIVLVGILLFVPKTHVVPVRLRGQLYHAETADTTAQQAKGLSGRITLAPNEAMLFRFKSQGKYCFWMKDTHFALDMLWINQEKKIVDIKQNVLPNTYPQTFCPSENTQYVLEVNAGTAHGLKLQTGDSVSF